MLNLPLLLQWKSKLMSVFHILDILLGYPCKSGYNALWFLHLEVGLVVIHPDYSCRKNPAAENAAACARWVFLGQSYLCPHLPCFDLSGSSAEALNSTHTQTSRLWSPRTLQSRYEDP